MILAPDIIYSRRFLIKLLAYFIKQNMSFRIFFYPPVSEATCQLFLNSFDGNTTPIFSLLILNVNIQMSPYYDIEFPYKILIGTNKEIELFNVRPSFVSRSPHQR